MATIGTIRIINKKALIEGILNMGDENYKFNYNGHHCYHFRTSELENGTVDLNKIEFVQSGNHFSPEVEPYMTTIGLVAFVDENALFDIGGGMPASSDLVDDRQEATECGEDPDEWVENSINIGRENISACLVKTIDLNGDKELLVDVIYAEDEQSKRHYQSGTVLNFL